MQETHMTSQSKRQDQLKFGTYGLSFVALGLALAALGPMLPSLADNMGVSISKIGVVLTVSNLGYLVGSAGGGRLYDRFKGHRLMSLALILMVVVTTLLTPMGLRWALQRDRRRSGR